MVPYPFTGKCQGDQQTLAIMGATKPLTQDVMTICPHSWDQWESRHISEHYGKDIADIKGVKLNSIANESPEVTLLHELTHTKSLFETATMCKLPEPIATSWCLKDTNNMNFFI